MQILGYIFLNLGIDVWGKLRYLPIWIAFYYGGMLIRRYHFNISRQWVCYGVLISFWGEVAETLYLLSSKYMAVAAFSQLRFTGFIYAAFLCLLFVSLKKDNEKTVYHTCFEGLYNLGVSIGNHSFNIFFLHMFFILLLTVW